MTEEQEKAPTLTINNRKLGQHLPVYIVAELSANHGQNFEQAIKLIESAHQAGADAVKLQTYTPDTMTIPSDKEYFRISGGTLWDGNTLHKLYSEAHTPWDWYPKLKEAASRVGIDLFSSAFDNTSVDFLESMETPAYKIASFEIVDIPLIKKIAGTGKPLIISTGMATLAEIDEAVSAARAAGATQIALLKCTSAYPAPPEEMNLRTIPHLSTEFHVPVGLSDHTLGITVPVAAVALGASIIEKHLTLSRSISGPDSAFSLEPGELKQMVEAVRTTEKALGTVHYGISGREAASRKFRRSLFIVNEVKAGEVFTEQNVRSIRPADGLHPRHLSKVLGRRATQPAERGTPLSWDMVGALQESGTVESSTLRLGGRRVFLRHIAEEDTDPILRWRSDPSVASQLFSARPPTRAEHEAWLAALQAREDSKEFVIVLCSSGQAVGTVSLRHIDRSRKEAELGIMIGDERYRGRGIAREACDLLIAYAFHTVGLERINLELFSDNTAARTLYERLGFRENTERGERPKDGTLRRTTSMYIDRQDWEKIAPREERGR